MNEKQWADIDGVEIETAHRFRITVLEHTNFSDEVIRVRFFASARVWREIVDSPTNVEMATAARALAKFAPDLAAELVHRWRAADNGLGDFLKALQRHEDEKS